MKISNSWRAFIGLLLFAAAFVHFTSPSLPDRVASHFAGGTAKRTASRRATATAFSCSRFASWCRLGWRAC